jgi:tRNA nucleotidyltransferase (CCA-adding enzyme)
VVFFLARTYSTEVKAQEEEVKEIKWLSFKEAIEALTFDSDKETLRKAEEFLSK